MAKQKDDFDEAAEAAAPASNFPQARKADSAEKAKQGKKLRITALGGVKTLDFKGKVITDQGVTIAKSDLSDEDLAEAHKDPRLAVELLDANGTVLV